MSVDGWMFLIYILGISIWILVLCHQNSLLKKQNELLKDLSSDVTDDYNSLASQNEMLRRNHDKLLIALRRL